MMVMHREFDKKLGKIVETPYTQAELNVRAAQKAAHDAIPPITDADRLRAKIRNDLLECAKIRREAQSRDVQPSVVMNELVANMGNV